MKHKIIPGTPHDDQTTQSPARRKFLRTSALAAASAAFPRLAMTAEQPGAMEAIDYARSFLIGTMPANEVRFWVESRTRIIDERSGRHEDFIQCASCKSESTFVEKDLFRGEDNYDFLPIFGPTEGAIFRRKVWLNPDYRTIKKTAEMWNGPLHKLRKPAVCRLLESNEAIRAASHAGAPIVAQTEIADAATGLRAIIEFPVKTLNIHDEKNLYQVDTGPVAFPDLSKRHETFAESLSLAFVAFNVPGFADFVIEDVTPLKDGERELAKVRHYSRIVSLATSNRMYALE